MRLQKYQAEDLKGALAQVKAELGPDVLIVSTQKVRRGLFGHGVEVTAAVDEVEPSIPDSLPLSFDPPQSGASTASDLRGLNTDDLERALSPLRTEVRALASEISLVRRSIQVPKLEPAKKPETKSIPRGRFPSKSMLLKTARDKSIALASNAQAIALVGPTGVGKTTTIAKLAARSALVSSRTVAVISVDTYRVGGQDQIREFCQLIGARLVILRDLRQLAASLEELSTHDRIYIDTAGRSPRDETSICELAETLAALPEVEVHLTMPADSSPEKITSLFQRHEAAKIRRLLFTKVDEAHDLRELVAAPARLSLPISYITTGQRVPEDLEEAKVERLLELSLRGFAEEREVA